VVELFLMLRVGRLVKTSVCVPVLTVPIHSASVYSVWLPRHEYQDYSVNINVGTVLFGVVYEV